MNSIPNQIIDGTTSLIICVGYVNYTINNNRKRDLRLKLKLATTDLERQVYIEELDDLKIKIIPKIISLIVILFIVCILWMWLQSYLPFLK